MIYFLQDPRGCEIKIGFALNDVEMRRKAIQPGNSQELDILLIIAGDRAEEHRLHRLFREAEVRREWFKPIPALIRYIAAHWRNGILPGDPARSLTDPTERETVRLIMEYIPGGCVDQLKEPDKRDMVRNYITSVAGITGNQGMHRVCNTVVGLVERHWGEGAANVVSYRLDKTFDGIGGWYA